MASACLPIGKDTKLGPYEVYTPKNPQQKGCTGAPYVGKPAFFGKSAEKDEPLFVVLDFEHYKIVRAGMAAVTGLALILGVALVMKKTRKF